MEVTEYICKLGSEIETCALINNKPLGLLIAFYSNGPMDGPMDGPIDGLMQRSTIFHLTLKHTPVDTLKHIWECLFSRLSDFGKYRIFSDLYLDSEFNSPLMCLLQRTDIMGNYQVTKLVLQLIQYIPNDKLHIYVSHLPQLMKLHLIQYNLRFYLPLELERLIISWI